MLRPRTGSTGGSAGLRTGNGGKMGKEGGNSGQSAGFGEDSQGARDARWAQQRFNGGGCDGKGPLFVLYPFAQALAFRYADKVTQNYDAITIESIEHILR